MNTAICAGSFIVQGDKFLFGKRTDESHLDALKRELNEELGITPTTYELFTTVELIDEELYAPIQYYIYFVTAWSGTLVNCSGEHSEMRWFLRPDLNEIQLASKKYLALIDAWRDA
jgi:8-oxo-dGTP pyrophosphatase MutT (NUDIX family)